jgi:hypothetical protein
MLFTFRPVKILVFPLEKEHPLVSPLKFQIPATSGPEIAQKEE